MKKFEFKKTYTEVDIAGKIYKIELDDDNIRAHKAAINEFYLETKALEKVNVDNFTEEQEQEFYDKSTAIVKGLINQLLGEDSYDELYEKAGRSIWNMVDLVNGLSDLITEEYDKKFQEKKQKYVRDNNRKKFNNHHKNRAGSNVSNR